MRRLLFWATALVCLPTAAAERLLNFGESPLDQPPPGFHSTVGGSGSPGGWKVILDEAPSPLMTLTAKAESISKRAVLAKTAGPPVDAHFPMLIFDEDTYGDFKLTTRFKIVGGDIGQMAGIVFRYKDEKNYYVLLASALDQRFWFFKMENGVRGPLIGPRTEISRGQWHEMTVECTGNQIQCSLNGKGLIPMMTDNSFVRGKIGFWTKSDSVSYFSDTRITYTPRESQAQALVREALEKYPRVLGLKIFAVRPGATGPTMIASDDEKELGQPAGKTEVNVIGQGNSYYLREKKEAIVFMPLRDRNGEPIAAVRVVLKPLPGQTEENAAIRARPLVKLMQTRVQSLEELLQ